MLKNHYTKNGVINAKVATKEQLFETYDCAQESLNPEFGEYIFRKAKDMLPFKGDLTVNIQTDDATLDTDTVTQAWQNHYRTTYQEHKKESKRLTIIAGFMTLFGIIALTILILINHFTHNVYLTSIVEIAAWVFIWQAVEAFFLQRPLINAKCLLIERLHNAQIHIHPNTASKTTK